MTRPIRASDATSWTLCRRRAWFDQQPSLEIDEDQDPFDQLVQSAGAQHEAEVLSLLAQHSRFETARDAQHTRQLMRDKIPLIYQPVAVDERLNLVGKPDFLILEGKHYRVADAKLSSSIRGRKDIQIQLALYRRLFATQDAGFVYLGNGEVVEIGPEADALADHFLQDLAMLQGMQSPPDVPFGYSKCMRCPYNELCLPRFEKEQALTLLYRLDPRSVPGLNAQGIHSIADLANADWRQLSDVPYLKGETARQLMVERAQVYLSGQWRLIEPPALPEGTWVHFDVESNPFEENGGQVYLWGLLMPDYETADFSYCWSDASADADYLTWVEFLQKITALKRDHDDLILAHYGHFEITQIRLYAARYAMFDHPIVKWLLSDNSPLFDLFVVTKRCLLLPLKSYGLKSICKAPNLVNFQWELQESGSQWSVVQYLQYLEADDEQEQMLLKDDILTYNRDDVRATRALEVWLRSLEQ